MTTTNDPSTWPPRDCEEVAVWLNARTDGECTPAQEGWLAEHLSDCRGCSTEWVALERTRLAMETARLREPADFEREALTRALAGRLSARVGWILFCIGAAVLAGYFAVELFTDESTDLVLRLGVAAASGGMLLLLFRIGWERLRTLPKDPYRNVHR